MRPVFQDLCYGARLLTTRPVLSAVAVVTAALGLGMSTLVFSVVNGVLLQPLPYPQADRIVYLGVRGTRPLPFFATSLPDFVDWKAGLGSIERMAAVEPLTIAVPGADVAERIPAARISPDFLSMFDVKPVLGRPFLVDEFRTGAARVALVSHRLWQRRWGGGPVLGEELAMLDAGATAQIVGVLPPELRIPAAARMDEPEIFLPLAPDEAHSASRTSRNLRVMGRLAPGVTLDVARQEAATLAAALAAEHPEAYVSDDLTLGIGIAHLLETTLGGKGRALWMLLGATGILLLVGCANVASLLLTRADERRQEIALRRALGASSGRIARLLLTESLVLGLLAGLLGLAIAGAGLRALHAFGPEALPRLAGVTLDHRVLIFSWLLTVATALLFGGLPATASARLDVMEGLRQGGAKATLPRPRRRIGDAMLVGQTALALVLVSGAGLLVASYERLRSVDPGFDPRHLVMAEIQPSDTSANDSSANRSRVAFYRQLTADLAAVPGVLATGVCSDPPLHGFVMWAPGIRPEGGSEAVSIPGHLVDPGFFATLDVPLLRGRELASSDDAGGPRVAVLSETAARQLWPGEDPLGKRLRVSGDETWIEVVGVVGDVHQLDLVSPATGDVYFAFAQNPWPQTMFVVARTAIEPQAVAAQLRGVIARLDSRVVLGDLVTMSTRLAASLNAPSFNATLLGTFGFLALFLAATGLFAAVAQSVVRRRHDLGIRLALGARSRDVVRLVVARGMALAAIGTLIGLAATGASSRLLSHFVFGITATDPWTLALSTGFFWAVTFVACWLPARATSRIDPLAAIREE